MKDIFVYNRPISVSEIDELYNKTAIPGGVIASKYVSVKETSQYRIDQSHVSCNQSGKATFDIDI